MSTQAKKYFILIKGGLGNQMSQYACYLSLRKKLGVGVYPVYSYKNYFPIVLELKHVFPDVSCTYTRSRVLEFIAKLYGTKKYRAIIGPLRSLVAMIGLRCIHEDYDYDYKEIDCNRLGIFNLFCGGWHCEKYFENVSSEVLAQFGFDILKTSKKTKAIAEEMGNTNSISIHVRRTDYITSASSVFGGIATIDYYKNAIEFITKRIKDPKFYIFSDDIEWAVSNLNINATYVDWNVGVESWQDMYLMSVAKHNIVCNSTFSWWGAWLNQNKGKIVICPNKFVNSSTSNQVYPTSWIRIDTGIDLN